MKKKKWIIAIIVLVLALLLVAVGVGVWLLRGQTGPHKEGSGDSFNSGTYIQPDYNVDGVLDEEIWEKCPTIVFGNTKADNNEVTFRYYFGERGITGAFAVTDPSICYAGNAISSSEIFKLSDAVFLSLDINNDNGTAPQADDIKVCIAADGRMAIARGTGSAWAYTNESIDYHVVVDGELNKSDGGAVDQSWTVEFFIPYQTYGIDKESVMGMMLEWDDSNTPSGEAERHIWFNGGNGATVIPELFHPMDSSGMAITAPDGWVPSMGRFADSGNSGIVAEDIRALAYSKTAKLQGGAGTVEATFDLTKTTDFFKSNRFSGLLLAVEGVGETEDPGWEVKNQYGVFLSNSETNPQLVVSSIRVDGDGNVTYKQIAGEKILSVLPNFLEDKVCTIRAAKNQGWIEIYLKDAKGQFQHLYDVYDEEAINGDFIGVRTAVAGFSVYDIKVSEDKPDAPDPYQGTDAKVYSGLLQELNENEFLARTAGTMATFGSLRNAWNEKSLKTITTSLTLPARPDGPEDQIKGILLNYDPENNSYLILDYRHGSSNGQEWKEDWRFYIRQRKPDGWGEVAFVMNADGNTTYDFRITPIQNQKGATEFYIEYKKSGESAWQSTYCKNDAFVMSGSEYGIQTATGGQRFSKFHVVDLGYARLDENRYKTLTGMFFGRTGGGAQVMAKHSMVLDKSIKLEGKNSYQIQTSFRVVPDRADSIKGIIFNYNQADGSYLVLDYRYVKEAYRLYVRRYDGEKWADTMGYDVLLDENAWYDFNIHVVNGKDTTTVVVESKTGDEPFVPVSRTLQTAMPGRQVGYYSTAANGMQFGSISVKDTTYIDAENARYQIISGSYRMVDEGVQVASKNSLMLDKTVNTENKDAYAFETSFQVVPDQANSIKGSVFNYSETDGSFLVLDYRYVQGAYRLYIRQYNGKSWGETQGLDVLLTENQWYNFQVHVINGANTVTVIVEYKTEDTDYTAVSRIFNFAMSGRKVGYYSTAANEMQYGLITNMETDYIGAEDARYQIISGAFRRTDDGVQVGAGHSLMLDRQANADQKDSYAFETSFQVVPDQANSIKGIVFNYSETDGSFFVLDYRYVQEAYRLYVRCYDGKGWTDTWPCGVILEENAWYHFRVEVINKDSATEVTVAYETGANPYRQVNHIFNYTLPGRQLGYYSDLANQMQYGAIDMLPSPGNGIQWPDEWDEALKWIQ